MTRIHDDRSNQQSRVEWSPLTQASTIVSWLADSGALDVAIGSFPAILHSLATGS
jgi:hypothetical protein